MKIGQRIHTKLGPGVVEKVGVGGIPTVIFIKGKGMFDASDVARKSTKVADRRGAGHKKGCVDTRQDILNEIHDALLDLNDTIDNAQRALDRSMGAPKPLAKLHYFKGKKKALNEIHKYIYHMKCV